MFAGHHESCRSQWFRHTPAHRGRARCRRAVAGSVQRARDPTNPHRTNGADAIPRVRWWFDFLTTEPIRFSTFDAFDSTVAELLESMYDPTVDFDDLVWRKNRWPGQVVVKCLQTLDDARRCVDLGFDGALLSSHEGRQLDRAPVPFELLPTVVREVGADTEVMIDTGPMAGGRAGVDRATSIFSEDFVRTMKLLGVRSLSD